MSSSSAPLSVRKNMLFNTVGSLFYQGCLWLITVLVVVLSTGYGDSGALAYAMTIGNMFNALGTYNMRTYQVSDTRGEFTQRNYVGFRLVTLGIGFAVMTLYSFVVTRDALSLAAALAFLPFKADEAFVDVLYGIDQRSERMDYIGISQLLRGAIAVGTFSVAMVALRSLIAAVLLMWPACTIVTFGYDIPHSRRFGPMRPQLTSAQAKALLLKCLPLVLTTLLTGMIVSVARQYFGNAFGNELLGQYAAVATPAVLVQAAARFLYAPVLVPLSNSWANNRPRFFAQLRRSLVVMIAGMAGLSAILAVVGPPAIKLVYGDSIAPFTYLFGNVLVSTSLMALLYFLTDVLTICRDLAGALTANAIALGVSIVAMIPLETNFGPQGINYTVITASLVGVALCGARIARQKADTPQR